MTKQIGAFCGYVRALKIINTKKNNIEKKKNTETISINLKESILPSINLTFM